MSLPARTRKVFCKNCGKMKLMYLHKTYGATLECVIAFEASGWWYSVGKRGLCPDCNILKQGQNANAPA
jgi:RNase P subunit RPR2